MPKGTPKAGLEIAKVRNDQVPKKIREVFSDNRTREAKALNFVMDAISADLGQLSGKGAVLLGKLRPLLMVFLTLVERVQNESDLFDSKGDLKSYVGSSLLRFSEAINKDLNELYATETKTTKPPSLMDLLTVEAE